MIVKIHKERAGMDGPLDYNFEKVKDKSATMIAVMNLDQTDEKSIREHFAWLERGNYRSKNVSFHMSISPNIEGSEKLSDEEASRFTAEIMKEIGMENQPYLIFRHNDIEREHFHVVSIRIKEDGRQISNYHDRIRLKTLLLWLQDKYHYTLGNGEKEEKRESRYLLKNIDGKTIRFNPAKGNVQEQFRESFQTGLKYKYSSFSQFAAVMLDYGFRVEMHSIKGHDIIAYQGLDTGGNAATRFVNEISCSEFFDKFSAKLSTKEYTKLESKTSREQYEKNRKHLSHLAVGCLNNAKSEAHFINMMRLKGVGVHTRKDADGRITGVLLVDHNTMAVYKGSELGKLLSANAIQERVDKGIWEHLAIGYTDVHGIGVSPIQTVEESDEQIHDTTTMAQDGNTLIDDLLFQMSLNSTPSKGKDQKKKKQKPRKARYI